MLNKLINEIENHLANGVENVYIDGRDLTVKINVSLKPATSSYTVKIYKPNVASKTLELVGYFRTAKDACTALGYDPKGSAATALLRSKGYYLENVADPTMAFGLVKS